jgi:large subunit ribosomal protein L19
MSTISRAQETILNSKLQRLGDRIDPNVVDDLLNEVFSQIANLKQVVCSLRTPSHVTLRSGRTILASVKLARARSIIRLLCARLAIRVSELANRELSPYGDFAIVKAPNSESLCFIEFENTTDAQGFCISKLPEAHLPARTPKTFPTFEVGDQVDVHYRHLRGSKTRIAVFSGVVIARRGSGMRETFTVRRILQGEGIEQIFPMHSPRIAKIEVKRTGKVRRAKLYYLRDRVGKATRLRERKVNNKKAGGDVTT